MSQDEEKNYIENHEKITKLTSNWKLIGIISVFINRGIISKSKLQSNITLKEKNTILIQNLGEPNVLNVSSVDISQINLFKQVHQSIELDLQYLRPNANVNIKNYEPTYSNKIPNNIQTILNNLLIGLTTLNEHTINFISFSYEKLYDQKIKKIIEYFIHQREYYLSIGRTKIKCCEDLQ